ncbi:hypothetical protein C8F01DRAFT_722633 [Mycena amicta]|nr:hypothetical protein C8F01DRAFT_722633 [Mycena amicta]
MFFNDQLWLEERHWGVFSAANLNSVQICTHRDCFLPTRLPRAVEPSCQTRRVRYCRDHTDIPNSQCALQIAAQCPNLRIYKVLVQNFNQVDPLEPYLELSHLHTLHIDCIGGFKRCVSELLGGRLLLPKLCDLKCRGRTHLNDRLDLSLAQFCAVSGNKECVEMSCDVFSKGSLAEFIRLVSRTLRQLKMYPGQYLDGMDSENVFDDDILRMLTPVDGSPWYCPCLAQLDVSQCVFSEKVLLDFIHARIRVGQDQTLKRVRGAISESRADGTLHRC